MPTRISSTAVTIVFALSTTVHAGQDARNSYSDVARALLANGVARPAPLDGTLKLSIATDPTTYALPDGMSSALLLILPDYQAPYVMTISSVRNGIGRTTEMFVPSGMLLDADMNPAGEFTEQQLQARVESVAAQLVFDDGRRSARYLLLYTRGDRVGQPVTMSGQDVITEAVGRLFRVQRSLNAKIEVATRSRSGYDRMQDKTPVETARAFREQGAIVKLPPLGKIKHTIPLDAPTFNMNGAPTSAVLVELPEFRTPYSLVIESQISKGLFVPSGLFFDGDFNSMGGLEEREFTGKRSIKAQIPITDRNRGIRYVLLFTRADLVGFDVPRDGSGGLFFVPRSIAGKLEIEAAKMK